MVFFPVNGAWGNWSKFGDCNVTCGGGKQYRSRSCNNPTPGDDGLECLVSSEGNIRGTEQTEYKICNTKLCSGKIN